MRYVEGAAEALPFPDASFDVVIFFNSLHHVSAESMDAALAEAARVLRRDGLLYVQEPSAQGPAFELLRPVNDETPVRKAAQQALRAGAWRGDLWSSSAGMWCWPCAIGISRRCAPTRSTSTPPARRHSPSTNPLCTSAFEHLGRPLKDGGYEFDQSFRINLFALDGV